MEWDGKEELIFLHLHLYDHYESAYWAKVTGHQLYTGPANSRV